MKASDYIADTLAAAGCSVVFGYQGSSIANLIDSIASHPDLGFIEARNEQGAAFAANGYALAKGQLGVAVACSGPGALNLITGIANAYYDSIPCLFITGQVSQNEMKPNAALRQYGFQETDITAIAEPITKYAISISDPQSIPAELEKAMGIALRGRKGPVLMDLPHNVQKADIAGDVALSAAFTGAEGTGVDWAVVEKRIADACRPVIVIGGGCETVSPTVVKALEMARVPVVTSYRGKGVFDNTSESYCGTIGVFGEKAANWALKYSDLALCFGSRLDGRQTAYEPLQVDESQNVVVFDIDSAENAKQPDGYLCIEADASAALGRVSEFFEGGTVDDHWLNAIREWRRRFPLSGEYRLQDGFNPNALLAKVSELARFDANFTLDVGQNQLWANASLVIGEGQRLIQSAGLGSMGFALPAAIGAYAANGNQTICIVGDGGFQMNIQELQVAAEYRFPLKVLLFNNRCLGLIRDYQHKALGDRYYGSIEGFGSPDYSLIAAAYGFRYVFLSDDWCTQMGEALQSDDAVLVEIPVSQDSTACPEPTYGESIINQSAPLDPQQLEQIRKEAYGQQ